MRDEKWAKNVQHAVWWIAWGIKLCAMWGIPRYGERDCDMEFGQTEGASFSAIISGIRYPAWGNRICIFLVRHVKSAVCGNGLAHCHWLWACKRKVCERNSFSVFGFAEMRMWCGVIYGVMDIMNRVWIVWRAVLDLVYWLWGKWNPMCCLRWVCGVC